MLAPAQGVDAVGARGEEEDSPLVDDADDTLLAAAAPAATPHSVGGLVFSDAYTAAAAALRAELAECTDPEDVLDVARDEVGGGLGPAGAAAALERLAALARSDRSVARVAERSPAFLALLDEVEAVAPSMRHRDLGQAAWALGAIGALRGRSAAAARALAAAAAARPTMLSARDHAALLHGLGRLRADPGRDVLAALATAAANGVGGDDASPQSVSMAAWAVAELTGPGGGPAAPLVPAIAAALAARAGTFGPQALAVTASSLARVHHAPSPSLVDAVGAAAAIAIHPATAAADAASLRAAKAAKKRAPARGSMRPRELTSLLFTLAEWRAPHAGALAAASARFATVAGEGAHREPATAVDWATAAWALATLGYGVPGSTADAATDPAAAAAWTAIDAALAAAAPRLASRERANALWGLALAEKCDGRAFKRLFADAVVAEDDDAAPPPGRAGRVPAGPGGRHCSRAGGGCARVAGTRVVSGRQARARDARAVPHVPHPRPPGCFGPGCRAGRHRRAHPPGPGAARGRRRH